MKLQEFTKNDYKWLYNYMQPLWYDTYDQIIGRRQVDFLLDKYFKDENIKKYIESGYLYYKLIDNNELKGVLVYYIKSDYIYMDKLYLNPSDKGKNYPQFVFDELLKIKNKIVLNVNQENKRAFNCYIKNGFKIESEEHINLGDGMINIDYKMVKEK